MTPSARLIWVQTFKRTRNAGLICRRYGVSRPTLRKWWRRYLAEGLDGLAEAMLAADLRSPQLAFQLGQDRDDLLFREP